MYVLQITPDTLPQHFQTGFHKLQRAKCLGFPVSCCSCGVFLCANWCVLWFRAPAQPVLPLYCFVDLDELNVIMASSYKQNDSPTHSYLLGYVKCERCCKTLPKIASERMIHHEMYKLGFKCLN